MISIRNTFTLISLIVLGFSSGAAAAQQSSSSNYSVGEVLIGSGGVLDAFSDNFRAKASLGDLVVGNSESANFEIFGGFTTSDQPYLEFYVDPTGVDFSTIAEDCSDNGITQFYVRSYLTTGYSVVTSSPGMVSENGDVLNNSAAQAGCVTDEEFFGINTVANTGFGADPEQVPDASFSFGLASTGYDTADQFKYVDGEAIAQSNRSTGQTNYTVSYVANASPITPAGLYVMEQVLIVTGTF